MENLKKRLSNPVFLSAVAGLGFQIVKKFYPELNLGTYQIMVDLVCYLVIGVGIYGTFGVNK